MLFGPGISLRFSGCKYILPPLSISTSTSLCLCACARQTSRAQCSELIKGFIPLPGSSGTAIWTLFIHKRCPGNNVYFYYHLGGVWVWGGGGTEHVCTHCFSWNNASPGVPWRNGHFSNHISPACSQASAALLSCPLALRWHAIVLREPCQEQFNRARELMSLIL